MLCGCKIHAVAGGQAGGQAGGMTRGRTKCRLGTQPACCNAPARGAAPKETSPKAAHQPLAASAPLTSPGPSSCTQTKAPLPVSCPCWHCRVSGLAVLPPGTSPLTEALHPSCPAPWPLPPAPAAPSTGVSPASPPHPSLPAPWCCVGLGLCQQLFGMGLSRAELCSLPLARRNLAFGAGLRVMPSMGPLALLRASRPSPPAAPNVPVQGP